MKKISFPYWVFLILLATLLFCIIVFFKIVLLDQGRVSITINQYYLLAGAISIISFLFGSIWVSSRKSWDIETFCLRLENQDICDHIIFRVEKQKKLLEKNDKK